MPLERYKTAIQQVKVGGEALDILCFADFDQTVAEYIDESSESESDHSWPVFGTLWPSALALATFLASSQPQSHWQGRRVVELGCGLALPSLLLARWQAYVLATDLHPDVGMFLAENCRLNHISADQLRYTPYDWSADSPLPAAMVLDQKTDYLIASDTLYDANSFAPLLSCLARFLEAGTTLILANPARFHSNEFYQLLAEQHPNLRCDECLIDGILIRSYRIHSHSP